MASTFTPSLTSSTTGPSGTTSSNVTPSSTTTIPCPNMSEGSSAGAGSTSSSTSAFGQSSNANVSAPTNDVTSSNTCAFGQSSNANVSAPTNDVTSMGVSGMTKATSPFSYTSPFASAQHSNLFSYSTTPPVTIFGLSTGLFSSYPTNGGKTVSPSGPKATSPSSNIPGSSTASLTSSTTGPSGFGQTTNSNVFSTVPFGSQCISAQNSTTLTFGSSTPSSTTTMPCPIMSEGSSAGAGSTSSSTSAFGQSSNANLSAPTNDVTSMGVSGMTMATSPFSFTSPFASAQHSNLFSYSNTPPVTKFGLSTGLFSSYPTNGGKTVSTSGPKATSPSSNIRGSSTVSITSSTSPSGFGQTRNSTVPFGSQCMSAQNSSTLTFGSSTPSSTIPCPIMWGGSSSGSTSSSTSAFGKSSNANASAPTNGVTSMGVSGMIKPFSPFASVQHSNLFSYSNTPPLTFASPGPFQSYPFNGGKTVSPSGPKATSPSSNIRGSSTDSKTDASAAKELKNQPKLQCDEMEKSVQLICEDVIRHQENMKSWIERYRYLELEKIEDTQTIIQLTQTIIQLREELAQVTKSKDAIIAEYLESPAFTKRLNEEHEKRLSEIFHPCYVKALHNVQTKLPKKKSKSRRKNLN